MHLTRPAHPQDIHVERAAILMPKSAKSMSHGVLISVTGLMMQVGPQPGSFLPSDKAFPT